MIQLHQLQSVWKRSCKFMRRGVPALWLIFWRFVRRRIRLGLYFVFLIAAVGNTGTLFSWGQWAWGAGDITSLSVLRNFATYTIAIAATSFADYFLRRSETDNRTTLLFLFGLMCVAIGAGIIVLCVNAADAVHTSIYVTSLLAAYIWFAANWQNTNLVEPSAYDTLGGKNPMSEQ